MKRRRRNHRLMGELPDSWGPVIEAMLAAHRRGEAPVCLVVVDPVSAIPARYLFIDPRERKAVAAVLRGMADVDDPPGAPSVVTHPPVTPKGGMA